MSMRSTTDLYEDDFFAWTQLRRRSCGACRARPNLPLDLAHIAEEIADLGTDSAMPSQLDGAGDRAPLLSSTRGSSRAAAGSSEIVSSAVTSRIA